MILRSIIWLRHYATRPVLYLPPNLATHRSGGANLEVFKFGMYIMFPIGWMYYFGTNLEARFQVPDFWPKPEETHRIPFEKDEQLALIKKLRDARLEHRRKRLEKEKFVADAMERLGPGNAEIKEVDEEEVVQAGTDDGGFKGGTFERSRSGK